MIASPYLEGRDRYDNVRIGVNSRLDSLQAAVLLAKLSVFAEEIERRQHVAQRRWKHGAKQLHLATHDL